jgi:tripartite-type tricarboxylate transporter receptor subunit TctC
MKRVRFVQEHPIQEQDMTFRSTRSPLQSAARRRLLVAGASTVALAWTPSHAESGVVTIVVPTSPGSGPDVLARMVGQRLGPILKTNVVIDNRSGANGIVGSGVVSRAAPDGKTLLLYDRLTLSVNPLLYSKLPYDPASLTGVCDIASVDLLFAARTDAPYKTWADMVAYARAHPGRVTVGTAGAGSVHHLSLELIKRHYGLDMTPVPFRGISPAVVALLGGEIGGVITGQESVLEQIRAGKLRALVFGASHRSPLLPDVPTLAEVGAPSGLLIPTSFALFAPAKVPADVIANLQDAVATVLKDKTLVDALAARGLDVHPGTASAVQDQVMRDRTRFASLIKDANIKLN